MAKGSKSSGGLLLIGNDIGHLHLKFQTAADALQPDEWVDNFYTEDATVRIANRPELRGREAMRQVSERQRTRG